MESQFVSVVDTRCIAWRWGSRRKGRCRWRPSIQTPPVTSPSGTNWTPSLQINQFSSSCINRVMWSTLNCPSDWRFCEHLWPSVSVDIQLFHNYLLSSLDSIGLSMFTYRFEHSNMLDMEDVWKPSHFLLYFLQDFENEDLGRAPAIKSHHDNVQPDRITSSRRRIETRST